MKKSLVYTKTGDEGMTSLVGGKRVRKTDARLEAYGTVDELNAQLGLLASYLNNPTDLDRIIKVQNKLFSVGSYLATDQNTTVLRPESIINLADISFLERAIDEMDDLLPPLTNFILPGGSRGAAVCHICRTVCRRAERRILVLSEEHEVNPAITTYINRLSDFLFVLSRKINLDEDFSEIIWEKG